MEDDSSTCATLNTAPFFQLTSSHGGWLTPDQEVFGVPSFQLTSSHGGWLIPFNFPTNLLPFQLTSSHGGWRHFTDRLGEDLFFNSHPHMEDNHMHTLNVLNHLLFNSHPHMEDDRSPPSLASRSNFSTHILTRRMTKSISTCWIPGIFQLTSSQGGWRTISCFSSIIELFNSHPHKEDDFCTTVLYQR